MINSPGVNLGFLDILNKKKQKYNIKLNINT